MISLFPTRGQPGVGGGADTYLRAPAQRRGTTAQVKGLYPWVAGGGSPMIGAPVGKSLLTHGSTTVCCDPINWFERARLISNPSMFLLALPGVGKSTLVRRIAVALAAQGVSPWVLGDVKGEYRLLVEALGGVVIELGRGRGYLNILDMDGAVQAAHRIGGPAGEALLADARFRRQLGVESLFTVQRGTEPTAAEVLLLTVALQLLDRAHEDRAGMPPVLADLAAVVTSAPDELVDAAGWPGDRDKYWHATESLRTTLASLTTDGGLGEVFSRQSTVQIEPGKAVVFDISSVDEADRKLRSALLLACWTAGFGQIGVSHALAAAEIEPAYRVLIVMDELWSALRSGTGLVDRVDALSRLNRDKGVGTIMISHTMQDLEALPTEQDRRKAAGLVERAGVLICGGLPRSEMARLQGVMRYTAREMNELVSWSTPPTWQAAGGAPPGQGKFLIKVGGRPGIPFHLDLTPSEVALNDTNLKWNMR